MHQRNNDDGSTRTVIITQNSPLMLAKISEVEMLQNILFVSSPIICMNDGTSGNTHNAQDARYSDAIECFQDGDSERALYLIDDYIRRDPHDSYAYGIKMQILYDMKRWGDVIECVDHLQDMPKFAVMICKASMSGHMGNLKKVFDYMDMAEKEEGGQTARLCAAKADILGTISAIGHPEVIDEAVMCAEKACSLEQKNGQYHATAAALLFSKHLIASHAENTMDILERSFKHGKKALKYGNTSAHAYYNIGRVLFAVEKFNRSIKYFRLAYKADSSYIKARGMAGAAVAHQDGKTPEQYQSAIKHMTYALENDPSCTFLYNGIGGAYMRIGDMTNAVSYLETATKVEPDDWWAWSMLTIAHIASGNIKDANRCHKIAAALDPKMPSMSVMLKDFEEWTGTQAKESQSKSHKSETDWSQHEVTRNKWVVNLKNNQTVNE